LGKFGTEGWLSAERPVRLGRPARGQVRHPAPFDGAIGRATRSDEPGDAKGWFCL